MAENICDTCGKPYLYQLSTNINNGVKTCKHDENARISRKEELGRVNIRASAEAHKMAQEMRSSMPEEKMITVTSTQEGSEGKTAMVPEKVVKALEEKAKQFPELL